MKIDVKSSIKLLIFAMFNDLTFKLRYKKMGEQYFTNEVNGPHYYINFTYIHKELNIFRKVQGNKIPYKNIYNSILAEKHAKALLL